MSTTVQIDCPHCAQPVELPAGRATKPGACPACGHALAAPNGAAAKAKTVPAEVQLPEELEDEADEAPLLRRRPSEEAEMDMTPMVDVTFLLLIFFIMTAAFSLQKSIQIPPTEEESAQSRTMEDFEEDQDYVVVRIDADNVFWISSPAHDQEQEAPSEAELLAQLRAARTPSGGGPGPSKLLVMASGDARHEYVVMALDAGTAVGMDEVKLSSMDDE